MILGSVAYMYYLCSTELVIHWYASLVDNGTRPWGYFIATPTIDLGMNLGGSWPHSSLSSSDYIGHADNMIRTVIDNCVLCALRG